MRAKISQQTIAACHLLKRSIALTKALKRRKEFLLSHRSCLLKEAALVNWASI